MITLHAVEARIKRQKIQELSGGYFVSKERLLQKIPSLKAFGNQQFLFGIYESEGKWTVLSVTALYASFDFSTVVLDLKTEADKVHKYFGKEGNKFKSDVLLDSESKIWMGSTELSCAIQNIILMLERLPQGVVLKEKFYECE